MASFGRVDKHTTSFDILEGLDNSFVFANDSQASQPTQTTRLHTTPKSHQQQRATAIRERLQKKLERRKNL